MRRKLIKVLLGVIGLLLFFFALYGLWVWAQVRLTASLQSGTAGSEAFWSILPQSALFYGVLAGFFILLTVVLIWTIYRLVTVAPEE